MGLHALGEVVGADLDLYITAGLGTGFSPSWPLIKGSPLRSQ